MTDCPDILASIPHLESAPMKKLLLFLSLALSALPLLRAETAVQYFDAGNPITYCGEKFYFAWSSRPYDFYILQEYLPAGETLDNYTSMFTVSVIFYGDTPYNSDKAIEMKIAELAERKKSDKVCNWLVAENDGEKILDFIVSDSKGGKLDCVEADIHYYRDVEIDGRKASVLLFYSRRAYGDDIIPFMESIPSQRERWYNGMTDLRLIPKFRFK